MPISLPSLDVLKTFVVVAQRLNFTHAARELHLTQGAVSRQILGLEQRLGYPLFSRQARGLVLTPQARSCWRRCSRRWGSWTRR